ncbi:hypothetical protein DFJ74DRAFT_682691 [Hyaloraphidium curvatum]|nr:hypothetical protein DFJ74DRAFT_682691 [Hyaloraphidium curvatum]
MGVVFLQRSHAPTMASRIPLFVIVGGALLVAAMIVLVVVFAPRHNAKTEERPRPATPPLYQMTANSAFSASVSRQAPIGDPVLPTSFVFGTAEWSLTPGVPARWAPPNFEGPFPTDEDDPNLVAVGAPMDLGDSPPLPPGPSAEFLQRRHAQATLLASDVERRKLHVDEVKAKFAELGMWVRIADGQPMTMESRDDRATAWVDGAGRVTQVTVG